MCVFMCMRVRVCAKLYATDSNPLKPELCYCVVEVCARVVAALRHYRVGLNRQRMRWICLFENSWQSTKSTILNINNLGVRGSMRMSVKIWTWERKSISTCIPVCVWMCDILSNLWKSDLFLCPFRGVRTCSWGSASLSCRPEGAKAWAITSIWEHRKENQNDRWKPSRNGDA